MNFTFTNLGYAVKLTNGETDISLQGNDAVDFLNKVNTLKDLWKKGKLYCTYEKHLEFLIDVSYF